MKKSLKRKRGKSGGGESFGGDRPKGGKKGSTWRWTHKTRGHPRGKVGRDKKEKEGGERAPQKSWSGKKKPGSLQARIIADQLPNRWKKKKGGVDGWVQLFKRTEELEFQKIKKKRKLQGLGVQKRPKKKTGRLLLELDRLNEKKGVVVRSKNRVVKAVFKTIVGKKGTSMDIEGILPPLKKERELGSLESLKR